MQAGSLGGRVAGAGKAATAEPGRSPAPTAPAPPCAPSLAFGRPRRGAWGQNLLC